MGTTTGIAGIALLVLSTGACSSGGTAHTAAPPPPSAAASTPPAAAVTSPAAVATSPAPPAPAGPTATGPAPSATATTAGLHECTAEELRVSVGGAMAAAGHNGFALRFTNTSGIRCYVRAYPGVAGLDAAGRQVVQAVRTPRGMLGGLASGTTTPPEVVLGSGDVASALVEGSDVPVGDATTCPTLSALLVTPPDTRTSIRVAVTPPDCNGIAVHPVVPGTDGMQQP